ncbi:unnamed protein product [Staurois parvus]|uniref:Uncharacterized protein n=1 Tax=Staurois parvus TaxID=386267 RepID=A0ABN9E310_9NEOB|nr:unnamed protein product [Staurois parvus]
MFNSKSQNFFFFFKIVSFFFFLLAQKIKNAQAIKYHRKKALLVGKRT